MKKMTSKGWLFFFGLFPVGHVLTAPLWWETRQVVDQTKEPDDFAAVNQGQLKRLARLAHDEMEATYPNQGGSGTQLRSLIQSWNAGTSSDDYAAVTVGQIKALSRLFHERMILLGINSQIPSWLDPIQEGDDHAVANIGQAKRAFSFEIPPFSATTDGESPGGSSEGAASNSSNTSDNDGILDADETRFGLNSDADDDASSPSAQKFQPDALGRLEAVITQSPHGYTLDAEGNISAVNL